MILVNPNLHDELYFIDQLTFPKRRTRSSPIQIQLNGDMECTRFKSMGQLPYDHKEDTRDTRPIFDQLLDIYTSQEHIPGSETIRMYSAVEETRIIRMG
jgi:hypothetical protein